MRVGILALQGDVMDHRRVLEQLGVEAIDVKRPEELDDVAALILPGGESTAIARLLEAADMRELLATRIAAGMGVLGTCAGLILLATKIVGGTEGQWSLGALDATVVRNWYGSQSQSFAAEVEVAGEAVQGVWIRAPYIEAVGFEVEVLGWLDHDEGRRPVLVRQGNVWGSTFHPELAGETRVHQLFLDALEER